MPSETMQVPPAANSHRLRLGARLYSLLQHREPAQSIRVILAGCGTGYDARPSLRAQARRRPAKIGMTANAASVTK